VIEEHEAKDAQGKLEKLRGLHVGEGMMRLVWGRTRKIFWGSAEVLISREKRVKWKINARVISRLILLMKVTIPLTPTLSLEERG